MLKPHKLCNVCKQIENNPKLLKDIYNSQHFMRGGVSLKSVHTEHKQKYGEQFTYEALLNHCKKHQFMNEKDFNSRHLRQIANQAEKTALKQNIEAAGVWDQVISQGTEALANGEMIIKAGDLLKAAKDKSDYELKTKDQEIAMAQMVYHYASRENKESKAYDRRIIEGETAEHFDPTLGTTEDTGAGSDGPGGVYYPPAWDALTPGTNPLP